MILLSKWSGRIMSEPLRANFFSPQHIIFGKECQLVQNKNLKLLSWVFSGKINLSKLTLFFSNLSCYAKTGKKLTDFSKF